jgi:hypothetical protein
MPTSKRLVSWKTARKVLRPAGISASFKGLLGQGVQILDSLLVDVTIYELYLLKPIPVPENYEAVLEGRPCDDDFEIISF